MSKDAIAANALFSALGGLVLWVMRDWVSEQILAPDWLFITISIGLIAFAVQLALMVKFDDLANKLIMSVVYSDIAWVLLTSLALVVLFDSFSLVGIWIVIGINMIVSSLAWLQFQNHRKNPVGIAE